MGFNSAFKGLRKKPVMDKQNTNTFTVFHQISVVYLTKKKKEKLLKSLTIISPQITPVNKYFVPREKMFLMYFWTLNSNMFPEFFYHPHFSLQVKGLKSSAPGH